MAPKPHMDAILQKGFKFMHVHDGLCQWERKTNEMKRS